MDNELQIRPATPGDVSLILGLIRELSEYERMAHLVVATEERIREYLFGPGKRAEAIIAEWGGRAAGLTRGGVDNPAELTTRRRVMLGKAYLRTCGLHGLTDG